MLLVKGLWTSVVLAALKLERGTVASLAVDSLF